MAQQQQQTRRFKTNMAAMKQDQSSFETGGGGGGFYKMTDGKHLLRILPPWSEAGMFYQKVGFHRPPGRDAPASEKVICPDYTFGTKGECPICKAKKRVYDQLGKEAAKAYNYQKRAYINVLNMRANEDGTIDDTVYILEAPATLMNPLLNFMAEENSDQLVDPDKGFNVVVKRYKDKGFTKYDVMVKPGEVSLADRGFDVDEVLDNLNDLGSRVEKPAPDDFTEILDKLNETTFGDGGGQGMGQADDDDDTADAQPARRAPPQSARVAGKAARQAPPDDDDDAPAPAARPPKRAPAAQQDDDDDGDAAPAPARQTRPAARQAAPVDDDGDDAPAPQQQRRPLTRKQAPAQQQEEDDAPAPRRAAAAPAGKAGRRAPPPPADDESIDDLEFDDSEPNFDPSDEIPF